MLGKNLLRRTDRPTRPQVMHLHRLRREQVAHRPAGLLAAAAVGADFPRRGLHHRRQQPARKDFLRHRTVLRADFGELSAAIRGGTVGTPSTDDRVRAVLRRRQFAVRAAREGDAELSEQQAGRADPHRRFPPHQVAADLRRRDGARRALQEDAAADQRESRRPHAGCHRRIGRRHQQLRLLPHASLQVEEASSIHKHLHGARSQHHRRERRSDRNHVRRHHATTGGHRVHCVSRPTLAWTFRKPLIKDFN